MLSVMLVSFYQVNLAKPAKAFATQKWINKFIHSLEDAILISIRSVLVPIINARPCKGYKLYWVFSNVPKNVDSSVVIWNISRWKMVLMLTFWSLFLMIIFSTSSRIKKTNQNTLLCYRSTYQCTPWFHSEEVLECFLQWLLQWRFSVSVQSKLPPSQPDLI